MAAVPTQQDDFIYISCGTWSLFGTELPEPIVTEASRQYNLTNEGGYGRTVRFLKNIMGLWLIQESRRQWIREGADVSYADLEREALAAQPFRCFINPDDPSFEMPGNLPRRVQDFCRKTGQYVPETRGEIMRCIYESLAMRYRYTRRSIEELTGRSYEAIHMIGGGTKDRLLCQMTADACNCPVAGGPHRGHRHGQYRRPAHRPGRAEGSQGGPAGHCRFRTPQALRPRKPLRFTTRPSAGLNNCCKGSGRHENSGGQRRQLVPEISAV